LGRSIFLHNYIMTVSRRFQIEPKSTSHSQLGKHETDREWSYLVLLAKMKLYSGVASYGALEHVPPSSFAKKNYRHI
jgi:hypothetical protein